MTLKTEWARICTRMPLREGSCYVGDRKIISNTRWKVKAEDFTDGSLSVQDVGYTTTKSKQLKKYYFDRGSIDAAKIDLEARIRGRKYGSAGFSFRASDKKGFTIQGHCIQAGVLSYIPGSGTTLDIFYRTTEIIKKFAADLVFIRDEVIHHFEPSFGLRPDAALEEVRFHFANVSFHAMFFPTLVPYCDDWPLFLNAVQVQDPRVFRNICRWLFRYYRDPATQKFSQAKHVYLHMERTLTPSQHKDLNDVLDENMEILGK